ncbi:MAG: phage tail assembly protein [Methylorubrum rhodinum]|uniref:phage tail assembly protein n=1 Tax=Methylorubrum rhodinum TaxID=29428 RepID=UPI003BAF5D18
MSSAAARATADRDPRDIDFPFEFRLSKPVSAHDEDLIVLTLREPLGEEVLKFGLLEGLSAEQFFPLVARLAAVPELTLKKMAAKDILRLGTILNRFFSWAASPET